MLKKFSPAILMFFVMFTLLSCSGDDDENKDTRNNPAGRRMELMKEELNLSETQVKEIEGIFLESRKDFQKKRQEFQGERKQMMGMMFEMRTETDKKIEAILDDGQKAKFEEYKTQRDERMKERMGRRGGMQ